MPTGVSREEFFARLCPPLPGNFEIPSLDPNASARVTCLRDRFAITRERTGPTTPGACIAGPTAGSRKWSTARSAACSTPCTRRGSREDTLVVFTSDHGDHDASHRLEHKSELYENACRVPLVVSYPGVTPPGKVDQSHLVSAGLDLIPTLCDYAGIGPPAASWAKVFAVWPKGAGPRRGATMWWRRAWPGACYAPPATNTTSMQPARTANNSSTSRRIRARW